MKRTYAIAQRELIAFLQTKGWDMTLSGLRGPLKVPYITSPDKGVRLWFKAQAIYYTTVQGWHEKHDFKSASSVHLYDFRENTPEQTVQHLSRIRGFPKYASAKCPQCGGPK
jgi:uncharacterized protein with PIN domain